MHFTVNNWTQLCTAQLHTIQVLIFGRNTVGQPSTAVNIFRLELMPSVYLSERVIYTARQKQELEHYCCRELEVNIAEHQLQPVILLLSLAYLC